MDSKKVKQILRDSPLRKMWLYHRFRYALKEKEIRKYVENKGDDYKAVKHDLINAVAKYHWSVEEFYMYRFATLTPEQRFSFVPEYEKNVFCDSVNAYEESKVFDSKWNTYSRFRNYFHRDVLPLDGTSLANNSSLNAFFAKNKRFLLKPDSNACGRGISLIEGKDVSDIKEQLLRVIGKGRYVVEQLIVQDQRMASFHPQSVNTVRVPSIRFDDRVEIINPFLRIGRGLSVVDNAGAGGIMGNINKDTGMVYIASDEQAQSYTIHPDTHVPIVGFVIPRWNELVEIVTKLAEVIPEVRYVGWDLALTEDGWVMVEGNDKGQFVFQVPSQTGFRSELKEICKELIGREVM